MREALAGAVDPTLPYVGVHLSDLTFMDEGNPDWIEGAGGVKLINFPKHHLIARSIEDCLRYQNGNYGVPPKGNSPPSPSSLHLTHQNLCTLSSLNFLP